MPRPKSRANFTRRQIYLSQRQVLRVKHLSERTGLKASEHIRRALDVYLASFRFPKDLGSSN